MATTQTTLNILVQMNIKAAKTQLMQLKKLVGAAAQPTVVDKKAIEQQRMIADLQKAIPRDAKRMNKDKLISSRKIAKEEQTNIQNTMRISDLATKSAIKEAKYQENIQKGITQANVKGQKQLATEQQEHSYKYLRQLGKEKNMIADTIGKGSDEYKSKNAEFKKLGNSLKYNAGQMAELSHRTEQFNFDFLSLLFAGMLMQRVFGGMFKSILNNYKKMAGMNSQFNKSVMKLQASFSYLKFAIANALESPGVIKAIEWFTNQLTKLGDYMSEHPNLGVVLLGIVGALYTIGTLAVTASMVQQMDRMFKIFGVWGSKVASLFSADSITALKGRITKIKTSLITFGTWLKTNWKGVVIGGLSLAGIGLSVADLIKNVKNDNWAGVIGDAIATGLFAAGAITNAFFSKSLGLQFVIAGAVVLGLNKISVDEQQILSQLEAQGIKDKSNKLANTIGSWGLGLGNLLGIKPGNDSIAGNYYNAVKKGLDKSKVDYKSYFDKIQELEKIESNNYIGLSKKEIEANKLALAENRQALQLALTYGLNYNAQEFTDFVNKLNAKTSANEAYLANQQNNIDLEKTKQEELNLKIQEYSDRLNEASLIDLFKGLNLIEFDKFKVMLDELKKPLGEVVMLLADAEGGLYPALYTIQQLFEITLLTNLKDFNQYINDSISAIPLHVTELGNEELAMKNLAKETNSAASAQERLNRARSKKNRSIEIFGHEIYSDTFSTTTQTT